MSKQNDKPKTNKKNKFIKSFKIFLIALLIMVMVAGGTLATMAVSIIQDAPEIDPTTINSSLSQTSTIYDSNETLIEKIDTGEYRTFVTLDKMPQHLIDAFISIEDERFEEHPGVDPKGIAVSLVENLKSGGIKRGASTITQQLVKNVYLSNEQTLDRKIKEAYLALQVEKVLHKDQIIEAYLNRNFFGQNAAGVQEAAQTYFSKDVEDLTLAESALFAGIVKSPSHYQPFLRVKPEDYNSESKAAVGEVNTLGERYILVFNEESVKRQQLVLKKMLELDKITQTQYDEALAEDIKSALKPGQKKLTDITSYFSDYVKRQVINSLIGDLNYTEEEAEETLYKGGLKIYSTVNLELQKELEDVYDNFAEVLLGNTSRYRSPVLIDWKVNSAGNIRDDKGKTLYYRKSNLLDEDSNLVINGENFTQTDDGNIVINDNKLTSYDGHIDIKDYYIIDENKNLVTYTVGSLDITKDNFEIGENGEITLYNTLIEKKNDFYNVDENGSLIINKDYFYISDDGIVQPQSASVVLDYKTGEIQSIVGGRDLEGNKLLNRATNVKRQPGSSIKPLSVYLPALDNGYTAGSPIEDAPFYDPENDWRPRNNYAGFKGMRTVRSAVEDSGNIPAIKTVEDIGISTSLNYLQKLGITDLSKNDENLPSMALGGMTNGITPLEMTAAFGAIANDGVYKEPIAFTKVLDKDGNLLLENIPEETTVVSPQIAYIMGDILRTNVTEGIGRNAQVNNMATAGKTGTTQDRADIWFVGYTPYYATGVWIGNDSPKISLNQSSMTAASFWKHIMDKAHQDLESKYSFDDPGGIVSASICTESGKRPNSFCSLSLKPVIKNEIFALGTVPTEYCDVHGPSTIAPIYREDEDEEIEEDVDKDETNDQEDENLDKEDNNENTNNDSNQDNDNGNGNENNNGNGNGNSNNENNNSDSENDEDG